MKIQKSSFLSVSWSISFVLPFLLVTTAFIGNMAFSTPSPLNQPPEPPAPRPMPVDVNKQRSVNIPFDIKPATAQELALAMGVPNSDLLSADLMGSDTTGVGVSDAPLGSRFPTNGGTFAILATGLAADASLPNNEGNLSTKLDGLNNNQGNDMVRLHMQLKVPNNANCVAFDLDFLSEEFPEWVDSQYNDTFTAQLNNSAISIDQSIQVNAPGNFAFDTQGNPISINTVWGVDEPTGTTYDGVTPPLRALSAVTPSATIDIYLSIQDLGDSIYDSAVFLDNFFWSMDPNCESGAMVDTDGDGLMDNWETSGLTVFAAGEEEFVDLPSMGADPNHKDIFIEVDWMGPESPGGHTHRPRDAAIQLIVDSFNDAPVDNPDGTTGIHLHVDYGSGSPLTWGSAATWGTLSDGDELTHQTFVSTCTGDSFNWSGVDTIKANHFTPGRAAVFHYNLWVHSLCAEKSGTSGISRNATSSDAAFRGGSSDFIASLGGWSTNPGTVNQQAGTFMHEMGHNIGLRHGGDNHDQWKPNHFSIMTYANQTRGLIINGTEGHFDYSRYDLDDLDENHLDETVGINVPPTVTDILGTRHFCALDDMRNDMDASAVDWNCDSDETDTDVNENINQGMSWNNNTTFTVLTSANEWDIIVFTGGAISQPGATVDLPAQSEVDDITEEQDDNIPDLGVVYIPIVIRQLRE